jgi:hypothetical protein
MAITDTERGPVVTLPGLGKLRPMAAEMLDFRDRLALLDEHRIGRQIVLPWLDVLGYEMPAQAAANWATATNDAPAAECRLNEAGTLLTQICHNGRPLCAAEPRDQLTLLSCSAHAHPRFVTTFDIC